MARSMKHLGDLADIVPPANASLSRESYESETIGTNDFKAQARAAAQLGYSLHGSHCVSCGAATNESGLCPTGRSLYSRMRELGIVS